MIELLFGVLIITGSVGIDMSDDSIKIVEEMAQRAEETVKKGFKVIWDYRVLNEMADISRDTNKTGVIGLPWTPLTTTIGNEGAKEMTTQPGWASWLVKELLKRGIKPGSRVAISLTGSFPALNLAVLAALQELNVKVVGINSIGASSFGANEYGFTWPELEALLKDEGVLKVGCSAVTLGGTGDRGAEWDEYAKNLAYSCVKRSKLPLIEPYNLRDAVRKRMAFYGSPHNYFCFINVGGSQAVFGASAKQRYNHGGWFYEPSPIKGEPQGVIDYFLEAGVPCLNLLYLDELNKRERILKP